MRKQELRVGIVGMGTIGRAIAQALDTEDMGVRLVAVQSRNVEKLCSFVRTLQHPPQVVGLKELITASDLVIEAATQAALATIAPPTLEAGKDLMVLSVGGVLDYPEWAHMAARRGCKLYIPSGAIVGLDGVKGACAGQVESVTITTRKPPKGLAGAPYVEAHGIDVFALTQETVIFEGSAREACKGFPANVNVSAALSLAGIGPEIEGEFGRMTVHIENVPSATNPRTGKLSYLSAIAMLKEIVGPVQCGN